MGVIVEKDINISLNAGHFIHSLIVELLYRSGAILAGYPFWCPGLAWASEIMQR